METQTDIEYLVKKGKIENELDLERAMIADRKLQILAKEDVHFKNLRKQLRNLIADYESKEWTNADDISNEKMIESDDAEKIAEAERIFIENRKNTIKTKLKELNITQQDLAYMLGHKSKTYMSELMNGLSPFKLRDLIIINKLLDIDFAALIPVFLSKKEQLRMEKLSKPQIKFSREESRLSQYAN